MIKRKFKFILTLGLSTMLLSGYLGNIPVKAISSSQKLSISSDSDDSSISFEWKDKGSNYHYRVLKKNDVDKEYKPIPILETIRVLNIYPDLSDLTPDEAAAGFERDEADSDGLKDWMETNGYGKGLITVNSLKLSEFNENPSNYNLYDYDVVMFGSWNNNNKQDLTEESVDYVKEYIEDGYGVLLGHDTINYSTGELAYHSKYFSELGEYLKLTGTDYVSYGDPLRGYGTIARIAKKGALTSYPYNMGDLGDGFDIEYSTTASQRVEGDIWVDFFNNNASKGNFYVTTNNNIGMFQGGHTSDKYTEDEYKLLANTLLYLGQVTKDNKGISYDVADLESPNKPIIDTVKITGNQLTVDLIEASDNGTPYSFYLESTNERTNTVSESDIVSTESISGIKGYIYSVDNYQETLLEGECNLTSTTISEELNNINTSQPIYVHVASIDNSGNKSEVNTLGPITLKPETPSINSYSCSNGVFKINLNSPENEYTLDSENILNTPTEKYEVHLYKNYNPVEEYTETSIKEYTGTNPGDVFTGMIYAVDTAGNKSEALSINYTVGQTSDSLKSNVSSYINTLRLSNSTNINSLKESLLNLNSGTSIPMTVDSISLQKSTKYTKGTMTFIYNIDGESFTKTKEVDLDASNQTKEEYIKDVKEYVDTGEIRQYLPSSQMDRVKELLKEEIEASCKDNSSLGDIEIVVNEEKSEGNKLEIEVYYNN